MKCSCLHVPPVLKQSPLKCQQVEFDGVDSSTPKIDRSCSSTSVELDFAQELHFFTNKIHRQRQGKAKLANWWFSQSVLKIGFWHWMQTLARIVKRQFKSSATHRFRKIRNFMPMLKRLETYLA